MFNHQSMERQRAGRKLPVVFVSRKESWVQQLCLESAAEES